MTKEYIDFQTIREDYSIYECENGQILKAKQTIGDLSSDKDSSGKLFTNIGFKESSLVITTKKIDTSKLEYMPREDVKKEHEDRELSFKIKREIINIYETANLIILLKPKMKKIFITNKKDEANAPILRYLMKNSVSILKKSSLEAKASRKSKNS